MIVEIQFSDMNYYVWANNVPPRSDGVDYACLLVMDFLKIFNASLSMDPKNSSEKETRWQPPVVYRNHNDRLLVTEIGERD
mmetsp:Transcript_9742/g.20651  ORF Transcript_9742/g.20651 Transcript_9742/m.20651 type:complete len:81 (-) Transcript_9742:96-338(-)